MHCTKDTKHTKIHDFIVKPGGRARLERDGIRAETRFGLSAKRTSPFKLAG